jgi:hypothetical protein
MGINLLIHVSYDKMGQRIYSRFINPLSFHNRCSELPGILKNSKFIKMAIEIITKDDLEAFRKSLLNDIKILLNTNEPEKTEWLRCSDVRKMLKISTGTLQNLRIGGKLKSQKIGGIHFYNITDIQNMLSGKIDP